MTPDTILNLSIATLVIPLLSFVFLIFFGKRLGRLSGFIGTSILGIDLLLAIFVAFTRLTKYADQPMQQYKLQWFSLGDHAISIGVGLDNLAAIMLIVVTLISFLVHLFSLEYMREDKRFSRFYAYLGIFSFSMIGIVIANNFLNMFIFWELVGLSSYLLIGFWYEKDSAANAGKKAFITNRIGDFGFLLGLMLIYMTYGTFLFDEVFAKINLGILPYDSAAWMTAVGIFVFMGAIGKSAQFPLHVWLPDAMEGPTPVSALIHAATMVAAGVYLTARVYPMFTADALLFIAYVGALTAFISATIAITQWDFKKVLAYSTVSQLGYMVMGLGVGAFTSGFMHLVTHAWFKALLFLASGSVIHAMHHSMHHAHEHNMDPQDIRNMGGLRKTMPITYYMFLFATLAISGIPLTSGFLSKDGILAGTLAFAQLSGHWLIPIAGFGAALMTAFYMFRLTILSFHGKPKTHIAEHTHENNLYITLPLIILGTLTIFAFYSFNPLDPGKGWFHSSTQTPQIATPHNLMWDFMVPEEGHSHNGHSANHSVAHHNDANIESTHSNHNNQAMHSEEVVANQELFNVTHYKSSSDEHGVVTELSEAIHHAHIPAMILSLLVAIIGIVMSFIFYQFKIWDPDSLVNLYPWLYKGSFNKWWFDEIYQATFINGTLGLGRAGAWFDLHIVDGVVNFTATIGRAFSKASAWFDLKVVDGLVNLSAYISQKLGTLLKQTQTGLIQTYLVLTVLGLIILIYIFI
jgi:NADH-quinone oxidoreductase subunit L